MSQEELPEKPTERARVTRGNIVIQIPKKGKVKLKLKGHIRLGEG